MKERLLAATRTVEDRNARRASAFWHVGGAHPAMVDGLRERSRQIAALGDGLAACPDREWGRGQGGAAARVLDHLLVGDDGQPARAVVLSAAVSVERAGLAGESIAAAASARGLRVLVARLRCCGSRDQLAIEWPMATDDDAGAGVGAPTSHSLTFAARAGQGGPDVALWLERALNRYDLVLVEGPPLDQSSASAIVGASFDGLLLLADAASATASQLRRSLDLVQAVGCHVFGMFVDEGGGRSSAPACGH